MIFINYLGVNNTVITDSSFKGGNKRYEELFRQLIYKGKNIIWLSTFNPFGQKVTLHLKKPSEITKIPFCEFIIIIFDESNYHIAKLISLLRKAPIIMCPRGNKLVHNPRNKLVNLVKKLVLKYIYNDADGLIFQTNAQKNEFIKMYGINNKDKIGIVNNSIRVSWIDKIQKKTKPFEYKSIGFIGDDGYRKGFDILLESFYLLRKKNPDVNLHICGAFNDCYNTGGLINHGKLDDLSDFLSDLDLLVVPSRYDSFPNVVLEAFKAGIPVIATKSKIFKEIFKDDVLLFELTPEAVCEKIEILISNKRYHQEAVKKVEQLKVLYDFDWCEAFIRQINDILKN